MHLHLEGRLAEPPEERNPGEFSPRAYDEARGVAGVLSVEGLSGIADTGFHGRGLVYEALRVPGEGGDPPQGR